MPLGDIQFGSEGCDIGMLNEYINRGLEDDCLFVGMGDYLDFMSPSNRERLAQARLYDDSANLIDEWAGKHVEQLQEILAPTKGRWLGLLEGHHTFEFQDGTTSDMRLASFLETKFLGDCALIRLTFEDTNKRAQTCFIWGHHGEGSSSSIAGPLSKLERVANHFEADVYLMAHHHKAVTALLNRLYTTTKGEPRLINRRKALVGTGSFLRGYMQGSKAGTRPAGGYVEQKMMMPVALGASIVTIEPVHKEHYDVLKVETSLI
jgi:hypothetical protein